MNDLRKHIECGEYSFDVAIDRDIAVKSFEEFPKLSEYVFTTARDNARNNNAKKQDEIDILVSNIRNKKMNELYEQEESLKQCVKFAFPLMLKKAGSELDANTIIDYIYENGVADEFNAGIYEMILLGFTQREVVKKKVNFSMK